VKVKMIKIEQVKDFLDSCEINNFCIRYFCFFPIGCRDPGSGNFQLLYTKSQAQLLQLQKSHNPGAALGHSQLAVEQFSNFHQPRFWALKKISQ